MAVGCGLPTRWRVDPAPRWEPNHPPAHAWSAPAGGVRLPERPLRGCCSIAAWDGLAGVIKGTLNHSRFHTRGPWLSVLGSHRGGVWSGKFGVAHCCLDGTTAVVMQSQPTTSGRSDRWPAGRVCVCPPHGRSRRAEGTPLISSDRHPSKLRLASHPASLDSC